MRRDVWHNQNDWVYNDVNVLVHWYAILLLLLLLLRCTNDESHLSPGL